MPSQLQASPEEIAHFCRKHQIAKLSLFGSVLRADFGPESDVDVLVEFSPGHVPGLLAFVDMQTELEGIFGRKVDLLTPGGISEHIRDEVLRSAVAQYAA